MKISILTLFPEMFDGVFDHSIIKLAQKKQIVTIEFINIRNFGIGRHHVVDDTPYGGGVGMVMRVDVLEKAMSASRCMKENCRERVILLDPQGKTYTQKKATYLAQNADHLILVCGRYEGVDERIRMFVDEEISIGDYVLTGGEIPTMVIIDSVVRLIPGVLKKHEATEDESFSNHTLLEYPQYTKPRQFKEEKIPEVLLSGNHKRIENWRKTQALKRTKKRRPDILLLK